MNPWQYQRSLRTFSITLLLKVALRPGKNFGVPLVRPLQFEHEGHTAWFRQIRTCPRKILFCPQKNLAVSHNLTIAQTRGPAGHPDQNNNPP